MPSVALARWASVAIVIVGCVACESQVSRTARDRAPDNVGAPAASATSVLLERADSMYRPSPDSAASLWRAALRLADSTGDSVSMARALTGLGQAARFRLAFKDARDFGERALALKLRLGMRSELFRSYNALGLLAWDEGRLTDALSLYHRASDAAAAVMYAGANPMNSDSESSPR